MQSTQRRRCTTKSHRSIALSRREREGVRGCLECPISDLCGSSLVVRDLCRSSEKAEQAEASHTAGMSEAPASTGIACLETPREYHLTTNQPLSLFTLHSSFVTPR